MSIGEVVLGAFLTIILQQLSNLIQSKIVGIHHLRTDLERLKTSFEHVQEVLREVEKSQTGRDEQKCLSDLRDVAYDVNDLLDEISTEGLRRDSCHLREVRESLTEVNPKRFFFQKKVATKIREINKKIQDFRDNRGLRLPHDPSPGAAGRHGHVRPTTGILCDEIPVFGRQSEAEQVVGALTAADADWSNGNHVSLPVIPILGIGGIGKTTLAQLVFNHAHVKQHFGDRRLWVHVPRGSDVTNLTKLILESAAGGPTGLSDLNSLQNSLVKFLSKKRYLLVLDNLWNERSEQYNRVSEDWSNLRKPLLAGAIGSRILITTQNPTTAKITSTMEHPFVLHGLSDQDCCSVFAHHAFGGPAGCERNIGDLVELGKKISKGCCGSPLAARALGSHLRGADRSRFDHVLDSVSKGDILQLSESADGILPSLESTYHQLPPHLKQCLRFCGVFPKGFKFEKDVLIRLWMAQGYLGEAVKGAEDTVGVKYFNSLVDYLFFKPAHDDPSSNILPTIRHSTLVCDFPCQQPPSSNKQASTVLSIESLYQTRGLYTLLLNFAGINRKCLQLQNPVKKAARLTRLRVLDLGNCDIERLHDSIKDLIHLRYLSLSSTRIKRLPESVCNLLNLQTLGLRNCTRLEKLPKNMKNMSNLRHLDLHHDDDFQMETVSALSSMPKDMGKLVGLQTLSRFVVSKEWHCSGIKELAKLNNIHGDLRLLKLHNIQDEEEAREANLSSKKYLTRVELQWGCIRAPKQDNSTKEEMVLGQLKLHTKLRELWIVGYKGASFPRWLGHASYSRLVKVRLSNCGNCKQLPPLGQLPLLEDLCVKGIDAVEHVDCGFCGSKDGTGFQSLRVLRFESMRNWKGWYGEGVCKLPALRELVIMDCPLLHSLCHCFPTQAKLFSPRS
ncbi:hypothetical protein Taro_033441 [Colocasia esculenta]|uniref:Disease resistance RPP13-like protein 1 n=1 Tax=Colocasia esculenta TaxID=4460 RepID=A0A843VTU7_COLES|nr:hypothetical protein [Colocasia esculenta]